METKSQQRGDTGNLQGGAGQAGIGQAGGGQAGQMQDGDMPIQAESTQNGTAKANVFGSGSTAFSTFYTWRANGVHQQVRFTNANVNPNSRVLVNISEYSGTAQGRFIGAARMAVYNIAPYQGGFLAWVEISWQSPLNVRFDVVVDP
jgi:hypothetical protein